jgi:hypothetical protein
VAISIAILILTKDKKPASYVFGEIVDKSDWNNFGFAYLIGCLSVAWTMTDYDATTHISEETHKAAIRGPLAIIQVILVSGVVTFLPRHGPGFWAPAIYSVWFLCRRSPRHSK